MLDVSPAKLIAVSKTKNVDNILKVYNEGQKDFGENYLQEALSKIPQLPNDIIWHFVGPIQSNKCKDIARNFHWVQSVDRIKIAKKLNEFAPQKLKILVQINIDDEITKSGVKIDELADLISGIKKLPNLELCGFMCIPNQQNPTDAFKIMQKLQVQYNLPELSMGMSADYKQALTYGATMVRLGQAIFGARNG
jgi:pyridoxal phosphate enzyme (YggS family)